MADAPTTRETADHAELTRLADYAISQKGRWDELHDLNKFHAAANPATVLALLSEIAALRGEVASLEIRRDFFKHNMTQVERQRDELRKAVRRAMTFVGLCVDAGEVQPDDAENPADLWDALNAAFLANQGADPAPVKKERAWICPQDNTPCPPECDSDDRRHCASVACKEQSA